MKPYLLAAIRSVNHYFFFTITLLTVSACKAQQGTRVVNFTINLNEGRREISPYIYGVNDFKFPINSIADINIPNRRLGGNAYSTYNWVTNAIFLEKLYTKSHKNENSDRVAVAQGLSATEQNQPAAVVTHFHDVNLAHHMESLVTVPMMSYVAKDKNGILNDNEAPPSDRFAQLKPFKQGQLSLNPDPNDNYVYTDEFIHFLVNKYGESKSATGIKFYMLDNEPNYWQWGHRFLHPERQSGAELINKSIEFAKAIKSQDPKALVFALNYGSLSAHWNFDNDNSYNGVKNQYPSYTAWFLKSLKEASDKAGTNLIDVIDLHYYSKAEGIGLNGQVETVDKGSDDKDVTLARVKAPLSLWNNAFVEQSQYTTKNGQRALQVIPDLQKTIDKYFPGLKISFGEYNFGGWNHISGAIAEADFLGILAKEGVFWASLWNTVPDLGIPHYQLAAIKIYRNYDGKFSTFGNVLVSATNEIKRKPDLSSSIYAAFSDNKKMHIIVINKDYNKSINGEFNVNSSDNFTKAEVWKLDGTSYKITKTIPVDHISNNTFKYTIPPLSIIHIVLEY